MHFKSTGWGSGLIGVIIFSGSLPATRVAVADFSPIFLTSARATIAALLGIFLLGVTRQNRPTNADLWPLIIVALGVVIGFPLLTALALQHITSAHSIVFIGLLPMTTALFGVLWAGERPRPMFWLFSTVGAAAVAGYALGQSTTISGVGDLLMVCAVVVCGLGYAQGAVLSRHLGGWQVISWALLLSLPIMAGISLLTYPTDWYAISQPAWLGLGYVSLFSMLIGFVFWYHGLSRGGIAGVGQLQLLQPFFGLGLAAFVLGEPVAMEMVLICGLVVICVLGAKRFA